MKTINTVNVIEKIGEANITMRSWHEGNEGNKRAEECFASIIKEHEPNITDEDINICLDNGYHEQGEHQLFIVHSS